MRDSSKFISTQIESQIPQFIRLSYPNFVLFLKKYFEWLEQEGYPYHYLANALDFSDVDRTSLEFLDKFAKNFLDPMPEIIYDQNNIATLVKNIEQYYSARGSEKAFKFMFRLFHFKDDPDHDLEFYYPSRDILRVSDGKWVNEQSLKIIDPPEEAKEWKSGLAIGKTSSAKAVIDYVKMYESDSGVKIAEVFLMEFDILHRPNKFLIGEDVEITTLDGIVYTVIPERVFHDIEITNPGKWNVENQRIKIENSGAGENARAVIKTVSYGDVTGFTILNPGEGYAVGERVHTQSSHDFGMGAYGNISEVDQNGGILAIKMMSYGYGYRHDQKVVIDTQNGLKADIIIEGEDIGKVVDTEVRDFGINYQTDETTLIFNTVLRVHDVFIGWEIGEKISSLNGEGIVEYWNPDSSVVSVRMLSGEFQQGDNINGDRDGGEAIVYDVNRAEGRLIEGCVCSYDGKYLNMDGQISALKYIQDSYFFQMFSYLVETKKDKRTWEEYVKNVHPAGTIGFALNDIIIKYEKDLTSGRIGPYIDTTEYFKFRWDAQPFHGGYINNTGATQIKQYKDDTIDEIANIKEPQLDKNWFCFGSEIKITNNLQSPDECIK